MGVTPPSSWPWIDHPVSGLRRATIRPIKTRFRFAYPIRLSSQRNVSRWPIIQKVRRHPALSILISTSNLRWALFHSSLKIFWPVSRNCTLGGQKTEKILKAGLRLFVCIRFQDLFHSPPGVLFAFPSRYWFTIGRLRVFSLGGWSPHIQTGFHVSRPTCRKPSSTFNFSYTGLSPSMVGFSTPFY